MVANEAIVLGIRILMMNLQSGAEAPVEYDVGMIHDKLTFDVNGETYYALSIMNRC
ncbi:hypothetical protein P4S64_19040 [Vibrio sp. M60_M31a]